MDAVQALRPAQAVSRRPTEQVLHREVEAALAVQTAAAEVPWPEQEVLSGLRREAAVARAESRPVVEVPWAQLRAAEAEPSVRRLAAVEEAQHGVPPEAVAAARPSEAREVAEELRAAVQAAAEAQHVAVPVVAAERPSVEPVAAQAQLSEARAEQLSAEPSARSDRQAPLARRQMTTALRREPALA